MTHIFLACLDTTVRFGRTQTWVWQLEIPSPGKKQSIFIFLIDVLLCSMRHPDMWVSVCLKMAQNYSPRVCCSYSSSNHSFHINHPTGYIGHLCGKLSFLAAMSKNLGKTWLLSRCARMLISSKSLTTFEDIMGWVTKTAHCYWNCCSG